jgi:hypothetical protein
MFGRIALVSVSLSVLLSAAACTSAVDREAIDEAPLAPARTATLTVSIQRSTAAGQVTSQPAGIDCAPGCGADFGEGSSVTLTAAAREGWKFDHWDGDCEGNSPVATVSMDRSKVCDAVFVPVWPADKARNADGVDVGDAMPGAGSCCAPAKTDIAYAYCPGAGEKCCVAVTQVECNGLKGVWKSSAAACTAAGDGC